MSLSVKFEELMSHLNAEDNAMANAFLKTMEEELADLQKDSDWLQCLEAAGVDNWSGIDFAHELRDEEDEE